MSPLTDINLDAYLARIGWTGPSPRVDVASLHALAVRHVAAIPFENLNPWLGLPVALEPLALQQKLVHDRRGGYCFEHNGLMRRVLQQIGFEVHKLGARVLWGLAEPMETPRTHCLLQVMVDGDPWVMDVGFGGLSLTAALRLQADVVQSTPHEPFRLLHLPEDLLGDWHLQAQIGGVWRTLYRFDLQHQCAPDDAMANHYTATHPSSKFVRDLIAARTLPDRRLTLLNRDLRIHRPGADSELHRLSTPGALEQVLREDFGLQLPLHPGLGVRLAGLFTAENN